MLVAWTQWPIQAIAEVHARMQGVVTVGDYDGVVAQVHIDSGHLVADVDEHAGAQVGGLLPSLKHRLCSLPQTHHLACFAFSASWASQLQPGPACVLCKSIVHASLHVVLYRCCSKKILWMHTSLRILSTSPSKLILCSNTGCGAWCTRC